GYMDADGYLYITGRKKTVIVLNNGKNVFPEEIEEYLSKIECIAESVVVGREKENGDVELTAVVYPNFDLYPVGMDISVIAEDIKKKVTELNRNLPSFKQIRNIDVRKTEFEKTTSKKIKRFLVK
ncbi:MAG: long-chain fatty acid--CoA ligase, partial [Clostridia bacterium]|nr:long-chain fatty acid--CoA ligase [Clostridia bacterium]